MARHASLGDFGNHMKKHVARKMESEVARFISDAAVDVVTEVAQATPIRTGQAQSNWLTAVGKKFPYYQANEGDNSGWYDSVEWAKNALKTVKYNDVIHITNNVPYIVKLNRGTSAQAPALFVQLSVLKASYSLKGYKIDLS
jgi:uncharacterized protein CbrC (UPF0167 family)